MSNAPRDRRGKRYWGDDDSQTNKLSSLVGVATVVL